MSRARKPQDRSKLELDLWNAVAQIVIATTRLRSAGPGPDRRLVIIQYQRAIKIFGRAVARFIESR